MSTGGCMQSCTVQQRWMDGWIYSTFDCNTTSGYPLPHKSINWFLSFYSTDLLLHKWRQNIANIWLWSQGYVNTVSALNRKLSKPLCYSDTTLHHHHHHHLSHTHSHFHKNCTIKGIMPNHHLQTIWRWEVLGLNHVIPGRCWDEGWCKNSLTSVPQSRRWHGND